jgi:hypothetical protein
MAKLFLKLKHYVVPLAVCSVSVYIALFLAEIILWRIEPKVYRELYHGLYDVKDGNPVLKPGYYGRFDLGGVPIETRVNSYGYRGHEPSSNPKRRVLLLGDSFAFGALLDQRETISELMEQKEPGLEVANLGVIAYNLPQQLRPLRDWTLPANEVVYLFYYNDFEPPTPELMSVNGYPVRRRHADGTPISAEEAQSMTEKEAQALLKARQFSVVSSIRLPRLRGFVRNAYDQFRNRRSSIPVNWWPGQADQAGMVARSLRYTLEMRDLAVARKMKFHIAVAPGVAEVKDGKHFPQVTEYIEGLRAAGIPVLDLLPRLSTDDYWSFDPHFNPKGAKIAADEIYKKLKEEDTRRVQ